MKIQIDCVAKKFNVVVQVPKRVSNKACSNEATSRLLVWKKRRNRVEIGHIVWVGGGVRGVVAVLANLVRLECVSNVI